MLINVCIITCQRPEGLERLLNGLNQLTFSKCAIPDLEVIVVDNEATGSAFQVCEKIKTYFKWPLQYYIEPQRGISYARNKAISCIKNNADFVVFIDDDEVPKPDWLDEILYVQQTYNADVVHGPALPYFVDKNVPNWVVEGKFFDVPRHPTGHLLKLAATNNVIIRANIFSKLDKIFDERFALTGGSDTHLFWRIHNMGYKMIWADDAVVDDWIPKSRTTVQWILKRTYRTAISYSLCEREFQPSIKVQTIRLLKGCGLIVSGILLLLPSLLFKRHLFIKALFQIYKGAGTFSGLLGRQYEEYKIIHKS